MARALGLGRRTPQRRLAEEGLTFVEVMAKVREDPAKTWLREGNWAITGIAFSLGFSDVKNFPRTFRKWTGVAPTAWRERPRSGDVAFFPCPRCATPRCRRCSL